MRRRGRRGQPSAIDPEPKALISTTESTHIAGASQTNLNNTATNFAAVSLPIPSVRQPPPSPPNTTAFLATPRISHLSPIISTTSSLSALPISTTTSPITGAISSTPGPTSISEVTLATEEARLLYDLYSRNVPPDEISNLMQVMRARRKAISRVARPSSNQLAITEPGVVPESAPPAYESIS